MPVYKWNESTIRKLLRKAVKRSMDACWRLIVHRVSVLREQVCIGDSFCFYNIRPIKLWGFSSTIEREWYASCPNQGQDALPAYKRRWLWRWLPLHISFFLHCAHQSRDLPTRTPWSFSRLLRSSWSLLYSTSLSLPRMPTFKNVKIAVPRMKKTHKILKTV